MVFYRPEFIETPLLDPAECKRVENTLFALKQYWTQRSPIAPFYTLGAASYLDGTKKEGYGELARKGNPLLKEHFGWLYDKLSIHLEEILKAPVHLDETLAIPGFHIFLAHPAFLLPVAKVHYDLQFQQIQWDIDHEGIDFSTQLSMTLSIRLPKGGGGLNLWDLQYEKSLDMSSEEFKKYLTTHVPSFHPYKAGHLVLHSGYKLHQIAPAKTLEQEDLRLTLQAHALFFKDQWLLYW